VSANVTAFNSGAVKPLECLRLGWSLIKDRYWLFLGITVVGVMVGSMGPMGIILGPMMCGIYMCLLARMRGEPVGFELLFKGFDYFAQSLIATLIQIVPMMLMFIPVYAVFFVMLTSRMPRGRTRGAPPNPAEILPIFITFGVLILVVILIGTLIGAFFIFTYPLIVDRKLAAIDAIKTSFKAVMANLSGIMGLLGLNLVFGIVGLMLCYVGAFLMMPISLAAWAVAYRQVFPPRT
jgi:hypothetical protein